MPPSSSGFDSNGRLGVVYQDNNTASFQDQTVQDFSPFVYFAKEVTGPTLLATTSPVSITIPRDARDDPAGDATFPNTAAGSNIPALDLRRASLSLEGSNLVAHLKLADASLSAMTSAITAYNAGAGAVARSAGVPRIAETRNYVKRITQLYYGGSDPGERILGSPVHEPVRVQRDARGVLYISNTD